MINPPFEYAKIKVQISCMCVATFVLGCFHDDDACRHIKLLTRILYADVEQFKPVNKIKK